MVVVRLSCEQLPGVTILGIGGDGPDGMPREYLAHAQQFLGLLKGNMDKRFCSRAFLALLDSDAGRNIRENNGGDLLTAVQEGTLGRMAYKYRLKPREGGSLSVFVTLDGMQEIMNGLLAANEAVKHNLKEILSKSVNSNHPQAGAGGSVPPLFTIAGASSVFTGKGIYVLRMNNSPKPFFYVGKADNIERRIKQHMDGEGAYCITGEPFTRVKPLTRGTTDDMESWERNEVLTRMYEFGIDNVRGWMYTFKTMTIEQKVSAFDQICEKFDFCRKCGRNSHFIRDCHSLSTDLWTCGMDLRPVYAGGNHAVAALDEASRRMAEARAMIVSATHLLGGGGGM